MFKTRIYQYDSTQEANGYRGIDFSKYVLQGAEISEDITQELDTAEITLCGLKFQKEFEPESKFIIDIVGKNQLGIDEIKQTHHFCVARDTVEQPILSDNNYFNHHISLIEPSVVAQKRLVDNIAVTYKLKNVSLKEVQAFPDTQTSINIESSEFTPKNNFGRTTLRNVSDIFSTEREFRFSTGKYFDLEGDLQIQTLGGETYTDIYNNIDKFETENGYIANFIIPKMAIMHGVDGGKTFTKLGYASISYRIDEVALNDETNISASWSGQFISNSDLGEGTWQSENGWQDRVQGEWLLEEVSSYRYPGTSIDLLRSYYKKYTETSATTPTYIVNNIPIKSDKKYIITISLYQFSDNFPSISNRDDWYKYTGEQPSYYVETKYSYVQINSLGGSSVVVTETPTKSSLTARKTSGFGYFATYSVDTGEIVYASSTPYSALALLQKAIINSSIYEKKDGVYIADVNNSDLPFYIDENFVDKLAATVIIENFYNQKNLWEIMLEVGNYIHAIPELKFGDNDRFMITFNQLGRTDEKPDNATKVSIFNSRSVEDYISATSSYITNMVQLGGIIEEWVVPKTTHEQLLVSNDTAEIIVSKPIIELLKITVKNNTNNTTADLTPFIYEENVYKTLKIDYDIYPNRGIAMYYKLGTNIITGGQFQTPQKNTNIFTDYTIKKILWCAFNDYEYAVANPNNVDWENINVSDYSFFVQYRTKDSVRQNHIRPDLRKYLINSKFDRFPEHNQFNNQTDVVVDSIKFGNSMYGKLIKTGNSNYEKAEWTDKYENTKHKGELYRINGELYYVAKITHYYFSSYILSRTTYSKDYNELSKVVGIPSEPRFYEISEQSLIWRELAINDILLLTDNKEQLEYKSNFVFDFEHLSKLILEEGTTFAKYALTVYKGDKDIGKYDQTIGQANLYKEVLNPINAYSSENTLTYEWDMEDNYSAGDRVVNVDVDENLNADKRAYTALRAVGYTDIYGKSALMDFYVLKDIEELDKEQIKALPESPIVTKYETYIGEMWVSEMPTDEMLAEFVEQHTDPSRGPQEYDFIRIIINGKDTGFVYTSSGWKRFIKGLDILATNVLDYDTNFNGRGIGLLKDCREAMSINFNLQLATNSDTFVISPYVFLPDKKNTKIVLLASEVNKLSSGYIDNSEIITPIDINGNPMTPYIDNSGNARPYFNFDIIKDEALGGWGIYSTPTIVTSNFGIDLSSVFENVNPNHFNGNENFQQVKAIAILCDVPLNIGVDEDIASTIPYKTQFVIARNIPSDWGKSKALSPIYFGAPKKSEIFKNKQ